MRFRNTILCFLGLFLLTLPLLSNMEDSPEKGIAMIEAGKIEEAAAYFADFTKNNPNSAEGFLHYGHALFRKGDYEDAITALEKAIELNGTVSEYYQRLGDALIQQTMQVSLLKKPGYAKKGRKAWEKAVELDGDNIHARMSLVQFCIGAPGFMGGGKDKAEEQAAAILQTDSTIGKLAYAQIYSSEKEYAKGESEYLKYLESVPDDSMTVFMLGLMYHDMKAWDKAIKLFAGLAENHPGWSGVYYQIGRTGALSGEYIDESVKALDFYISNGDEGSSPSLAHAHHRLGNVYEKAGRIDEAKAEYQAAMKLDPEEKTFKKALKRCK